MPSTKLLYKYLKENKVLVAYTDSFRISKLYTQETHVREGIASKYYTIHCAFKPYYKSYEEKKVVHVSFTRFNAWIKKSRLDTLNEILE